MSTPALPASPRAHAHPDKMRLRYLGRQGQCRYYWRLISGGGRVLYYVRDGGRPAPVSY